MQEYSVNNVWSCTTSLPYVFVVCTGTTKCYIYQAILTLSLFILMCHIYDFFYFIHWEIEICLLPFQHITLML